MPTHGKLSLAMFDGQSFSGSSDIADLVGQLIS